MITCKELIDFLMDYVDDGLPPERRSAFEAHLKVCPPCVNYLSSYKEAVRMGKAALSPTPDDSIPSSVPPKLIEAILAARRAGA